MAPNKLKKNNNMYKIYKYGGSRRIQLGYGHQEYRPAGCKVPKYVHLIRTMACGDSPKWCYPIYTFCWVMTVISLIWSIYVKVMYPTECWWYGLICAAIFVLTIYLLWNFSPSTPGRNMYIVRVFDKRDIPKLKKRFVIRFRLGCSVIMWDKKR